MFTKINIWSLYGFKLSICQEGLANYHKYDIFHFIYCWLACAFPPGEINKSLIDAIYLLIESN